MKTPASLPDRYLDACSQASFSILLDAFDSGGASTSPSMLSGHRFYSLKSETQHYTSDQNCMSAFRGPLAPNTALGCFSSSDYSEASTFIITYPVSNVIDKESNETKRAITWEKAFIKLVQVLFGLSGVMLVVLSVMALVVFFSTIGVKSTLVIMEVILFFVLANNGMIAEARSFKLDQLLSSVILGGSEDTTKDKSRLQL
ncbi:hypothetical protein LXL04_013192 [Taraxacum kok-saghyz]